MERKQLESIKDEWDEEEEGEGEGEGEGGGEGKKVPKKAKSKKKKKSKKNTKKGNDDFGLGTAEFEEEDEQQPQRRFPWYHTVGPLFVVVMLWKYARPTLLTSAAILLALALVAVVQPS